MAETYNFSASAMTEAYTSQSTLTSDSKYVALGLKADNGPSYTRGYAPIALADAGHSWANINLLSLQITNIKCYNSSSAVKFYKFGFKPEANRGKTNHDGWATQDGTTLHTGNITMFEYGTISKTSAKYTQYNTKFVTEIPSNASLRWFTLNFSTDIDGSAPFLKYVQQTWGSGNNLYFSIQESRTTETGTGYENRTYGSKLQMSGTYEFQSRIYVFNSTDNSWKVAPAYIYDSSSGTWVPATDQLYLNNTWS